MSVEEQDYKVEVLEYAVNQCIDGLLPSSSEDALSVILYQSNEVVWRVATEIYTKSGHQVDFAFIRDVINLRIEPLQKKIIEEERIRKNRELEEAVIRAELETIRLAKEIEEERLRKEREAEKERIEAEQERIKKEREAEEWKELQEFKKANPDIKINTYKELKIYESEVFAKVKKVIVEQLEVEENQIEIYTLFDYLIPDYPPNKTNNWCCSSGFIDDRDLDLVEFITAIEEEFDIEISDEECDDLFSWNVGELVNLVTQKLKSN